MLSHLLEAFWIFLPAGVANMTPVIANKIPWLASWDTPLDLGYSLGGKRILGDNKRLRGVVLGTMAAGVVGVLQFHIYNFHLAPETEIISFLAAALLGFGALMGDAIESLIKRRVGIKPGNSWFPFDQIDYIVGGLLVWVPVLVIPGWLVAYVLVVYFGLHLVVSYLGYLLGFKDKPI